jgi:type III secretion protein V
MFRKDLILVALIVCILSLMIIPLNPAAIDILLTLNITLSILLLMVGIYIKNPSDFSTFPSVILIGTAFRLALSIGTTRLILTEAEGGDIIQTFGDFVIGGSIAVGLVVFLIITVVQFLVVTKGAERVAEVAARFTLDALPGKQMAIDADIKAGTISAAEGDKLRRLLNKESQFFGAMDGAMKFVKGDAIAGLIIIFINLVGGMIVGVALHGMSFSDSASLFTLLTIGDGLVAQIPALLMALCAGVVVTRATGPENSDLGTDISRELLADPRVPAVASILVFAMGSVPGFPFFIFAGAAAVLALSAATLVRKKRRDAAKAEPEPAVTANSAKPDVAERSMNDRYLVWIGEDLASRLDLERLQALVGAQFELQQERSGVPFLCPPIQIAPDIGASVLRVCLDDVPLLSVEIPADRVFVAASEEKLRSLPPGSAVQLNLPGWVGCHVPTAESSAVAGLGLDTVNPTEVAVTTIFRLFERNIAQLFGRKEFEALLATFNEVDSQVMATILQTANQSVLFRVFRSLISDGVPLRPAALVVESLGYWTQMPEVATPYLLEDCLRGSLKRQICHALADRDGILGVVMVHPDYEAWMRKLGADGKKGVANDTLPIPADWIDPVLRQFREMVQARCSDGRTVAVVIDADLRRRLRGFLAANDVQVPVLAPHELAGESRCFPLDVLRQPGRSDPQLGALGSRQVA